MLDVHPGVWNILSVRGAVGAVQNGGAAVRRSASSFARASLRAGPMWP
jgi:hypothetical protein